MPLAARNGPAPPASQDSLAERWPIVGLSERLRSEGEGGTQRSDLFL